LAARAVQLGWQLPPEPSTTDDPPLALLVDGRRLAPVSVAHGLHVFLLPAARTAVRLVSRSAVANETRPWVSDDRRLGVLPRELTVRSGRSAVPIPLDHPALGDGWWQPEWHDPTALRRWTNGDGLVPMPDIHLTEAGPCLLEVEVAATPPYPLPATGGVKDARAA
jgi:hypothetical protein